MIHQPIPVASRCGRPSDFIGTVTDPYQPCDGRYGDIRGVMEVLGERCNAMSIVKKSTLVRRDLDWHEDLAQET
jgi:DNA repair photolyase